jgi:magnesium transporter
MNEIMKVLTIISTIFIPITFITSLYGMNFKNMPELDWRYGYPAAVAVMVLVSCGMLLFFRRKKWI